MITAARLLVDFNRNVPDALTRLHEATGPVATYGLGPMRATYLFGPAANELVHRDPETFRWGGACDPLVPVIGSTALLVSDGDAALRRRGVVRHGFRQEGVERFFARLLRDVDALIDSWRPGTRLNVFETFRATVHSSAIAAFFGPRLGGVGADLAFVFRLLNRSLPRLLLLQRVPNPLWRKACAALDRVDREIAAELARRRAGEPGDGDLLDLMLAARTDDGPAMSDREIRDMVVDLIYANFDTVSSALAFAVNSIWSDDEILYRARAQVAGLGSRPPTMADVRGLTYLDWVTSEVLRLYPPSMLAARRVARPFSFAGHHGRPGDLVFLSPFITHRLPRIWPDPERFMPERWNRDRPGYRAPSSFEYLPLSMGNRRCLAANLSRAEIIAVIARLLQRVELTIEAPARPAGFAALIPHNGVTARVSSTY